MDEGQADYRNTDLYICGQPKAADGLLIHQKELEGVVAPLVCRKKTRQTIRFKGKKCYLTDSVPAGHMYAVLALMSLYSLQEAMEEKNVDQVAKQAMCFVTSLDHFTIYQKFGVAGIDAIIEAKRVRGNRQIGGVKSGKFHADEDATKFQFAYAKHASKRNWAKATAQELVANYGYDSVDDRTVRRTVAKLNLRKQAPSTKTESDNA